MFYQPKVSGKIHVAAGVVLSYKEAYLRWVNSSIFEEDLHVIKIHSLLQSIEKRRISHLL